MAGQSLRAEAAHFSINSFGIAAQPSTDSVDDGTVSLMTFPFGCSAERLFRRDELTYIIFPSSFTAIAQRHPETWNGTGDSKRAEECRDVLRNALSRLEPGGEIRIDWHYLGSSQFFWVGALLLGQEPTLQWNYDDHFLSLSIP